MTLHQGILPILQVRNLTKSFGKVAALKGISFDILPHQCFGLLGPNGAGKTTTIELIEGLIKPDSGEIKYQGEKEAKQYRKDTGIQFQNTTLQDFLSVKENLDMFSKFYPKTISQEELINICSLEEFLDRDVRKLSGGQRQRVALALALIGDPSLIFLDEPTMGLDAQSRRNFWRLIERIKAKKKTIVLTTHYMEEAYELCDEVLIIDHGRVVTQGAPKQLVREHYQDLQIQIPFDVFETPIESLNIPFTCSKDLIIFKTNQLNETLSVLINAHVRLDDMVIYKPTLEDLFIELTGHSLRD